MLAFDTASSNIMPQVNCPVEMMKNKLFVRNISFKLSEEELAEIFSSYGTVVSCSMPLDRETGRKKGFAFVEMGSQEEAEAAIRGLDTKSFAGRDLSVSFSEPKPRQNR